MNKALFVTWALASVITGACAHGIQKDRNLQSLFWMVGDWRGRLGEGRIEEVWDEPLGTSMTGRFRAVAGMTPKFYELNVIELDQKVPVMRIRHFNPDLTAWEDKDHPLNFRLVEQSYRRAVFENREVQPPERLIYERQGNHLQIRLEKTENGRPSRHDFQFRRH